MSLDSSRPSNSSGANADGTSTMTMETPLNREATKSLTKSKAMQNFGRMDTVVTSVPYSQESTAYSQSPQTTAAASTPVSEKEKLRSAESRRNLLHAQQCVVEDYPMDMDHNVTIVASAADNSEPPVSVTEAAETISGFSSMSMRDKRQTTIATTTPSSDEHLTVSFNRRSIRNRALSTSDRPPVSIGGSNESKASDSSTSSSNASNSLQPGSQSMSQMPSPRSVSPTPSDKLGNSKRTRAFYKQPTIETTEAVRRDVDDDYEVLNQYTLYNELGRGAYGVVKLAIDNNNGERFAIKIISKKRMKKKAGFGRMPPNRKPDADDSSPLNNVKREIAILKKLSHVNVVKLHEVIDDIKDDNLYLVFELVDGGAIMEIQEVMTADPFPEDLARKYFIDLVLGIEYLHKQNIIHRDIKPGNLLLAEGNRIKITDFGVSQMSGENDIITKTAGSPAFLAPEAISADISQYNGKPVDIWAMGVTLYCFIYGRCPFISSSILDLHEKIKNDDIKFPQKIDVNPQLKDLITKMLIKDPNDRITLPEIKVHPWVTRGGLDALPDEEIDVLEVTDSEVESAVHTIVSLGTLILLKAMGKRKTLNPFKARSAVTIVEPSNSQLEVTNATENTRLEAKSAPVIPLPVFLSPPSSSHDESSEKLEKLL